MGAVFFAALLLDAFAPAETAATHAVAHTRAYWFLGQWRWYEWVGAAAPCLLLLAIAKTSNAARNTLQPLANAALLTTTIATALALCFARENAASLAVARLQPLRSLHLVFVAFLAVGAACLQRHVRNTAHRCAALTALAVAAVSLVSMQRTLFPNTPHLELPGTRPANAWELAFLWCRANTPRDALFALDSNYINQPGEDSHAFRAIALRSALPDNVKDAGIAAVLPALTPAWRTGSMATRDLNHLTDAERNARLLPLGVTWIVLPATSTTALPCPFHNAAAQVCRLR